MEPALPGNSNLIVAGGFRGAWHELPQLVSSDKSVVLAAEQVNAAAAAWHHCQGGRETLIAADGRLGADELAALRAEGFAIHGPDGIQPASESSEVDHGRLWLLTSGSTGRPKRVAHTLVSLATVGGQQPPRRWLCPYSPGTYAWWQVVTLSLLHPGQDVVFVDPTDLASWPAIALREGVTAASGTPTFWRQALLTAGATLAQIPLEQISLGGEPVDQAILDQLRAVFPQARLTWIYASSEAGAAIAVHDGKAGFPEEWLSVAGPDRPRLSVSEHELLIESPWSADGMPQQIRTGDRTEVRDGRVFIVARIAQDEINVGGAKASAAAVRETLLAHPGVIWAAVRGRQAPLVGRVVVADVVLAREVTEAELTEWCRNRLPDYAVPRRLRVLTEIPMKETLKSDV